jgi:glycosyltransferase involved in cell wall biosynthesis
MMPIDFYYWISANPPVLRHSHSREHDIGLLLPTTRIYRLLKYTWHCTADEIERYHWQAKKNRPQHVLFHLVDESELLVELKARGISSEFVSHNAILDEKIFTIKSPVQKEYDAVYNARMSDFKRHLLAKGIPRLLMIGGVSAEGDSQSYFAKVRREIPQAHFTHAANNAELQSTQVADLLNRAKVGLCLSSVEGAMYASVEYLLCGLPVVSTASRGGRYEWFDTRFVRVVRDDPNAVASAVAELISLKLSPNWIRQQTLRKVWEHRRRFVEVVQNIYDKEGADRDFAREWYAGFCNKMGFWRSADQVMSYLAKDCFRR